MKRLTGYAGALLLVFLVATTCWATPAMKGARAASAATVVQENKPAGEEAQWTLIYYLAADNEQEAYADATIAQLVAGTAGVANHPRILVLIDRLSVPGIEVFEVAGGQMISQPSQPEQNTADGEVLEKFATDALNQADHDRVAFIMKSEGLSWRGIGRDNTHDEESDDQLMPVGALSQALIDAQTTTDRKVDLLVLEGSIMAFMEVVYELRDAAPYLLATQSKIQPDGLAWEMVIRDLIADPDMTAGELGIAITDDTMEYYADKGNNGVPQEDTSTNFAALTLFDLSQMGDVLAAHRAWAETCWSLFDDIYNLLPHARDLAEVGGFGEVTDFDYNFDMQTFMVESLRLIAEAGLDFPELTKTVDDYLSAQDELVVYEQSPEDGDKLRAATGLSIWYPPTWNKYETRDESDEIFGSTMYYEDPEIGLDWIVDSNWLTYLFEYFDRADAKLEGDGTDGDEPPKTGVFNKINAN
ncbi:MAG: clostripain-related cysteine peptidase [Thermodesulfobacteriota bacterium]